MQMQTVASIEIARPIDQVFAVATDHRRLSEFMTKVGPIPGVLSIEYDGGQACKAGATRQVAMSDKSTIGEEVLAHDPPGRHAYRWMNPPAPPFSLIVRGAEADWRFSRSGAGTRIDWTYTFRLSTFLVYPLAALIIALFNKWMMNALHKLKNSLAE